MLELLSFSEVFHRLLDLYLLELESLVTGVYLHLKVFNVLNKLQDLLILHVKVHVKLNDDIFEAMLLINELLCCGCPRIIKSTISTHLESLATCRALSIKVILSSCRAGCSLLTSFFPQASLRLVQIGAARIVRYFQLIALHLVHEARGNVFVLIDFHLELFTAGDADPFGAFL